MDLTNYWKKVKKTSSCWFWLGANTNGYGYWAKDGKMHSVHRLSYELVSGGIPEGLEVDHLCGNRNCVNPEHLEAIEHIVNANRSRLVKHGNTPLVKKDVADKKFLLYIHDPLFKLEPKKSQLVNNLLERHYHDTVGGKTQDEVHADIKVAQEALKSAKVPTQERYVQTPEGIVGPISLKLKKDAFDALKQTFGVALCKHGASPGLCKHAKIVNGKKACK